MKQTLKSRLVALFAVPALALSVVGAGALSTNVLAVDIQGGSTAAKGDKTPDSLFGDDTGTGGIFKIRYTVSGGDSSAVTAAKNTILYAVVGIIVAILAYAIVNFVITSFTSTT
jgi:hypothetical protein